LSFDGRSFCISYGRQDQVSQKAWLIDLWDICLHAMYCLL
jgi:hypothetical protein